MAVAALKWGKLCGNYASGCVVEKLGSDLYFLLYVAGGYSGPVFRLHVVMAVITWWQIITGQWRILPESYALWFFFLKKIPLAPICIYIFH